MSELARARGRDLREIHFGNSLRLTDASLAALSAHCPLLRGLGLSCTAATMRGVLLLQERCPWLVEHRCVLGAISRECVSACLRVCLRVL